MCHVAINGPRTRFPWLTRTRCWVTTAALVCLLSQGAFAQSPCDPALPLNNSQSSGYNHEAIVAKGSTHAGFHRLACSWSP